MTPGNATTDDPVGPGMRENNAKSRRRERRKLAAIRRARIGRLTVCALHRAGYLDRIGATS